ncbi:MAG: hypothetical protein WCT04_01390 [Planctomycetota bacterium]
MPNPSRFSQAVRRGCWLILSLSVQLAPHCAEDNTPDSDPALKFKARELSADETKMARAWFKELGSDAYDIRERALAKIIGQGPTVLPVATEFVNDPDPEIAATSRGLRAKILVKYDGYLPSDPTLLAALEKTAVNTVVWTKNAAGEVLPIKTLLDVCQKLGIKIEIDTASVNSEIGLNEELFGPQPGPAFNSLMSVGASLNSLATMAHAHIIPRGDCLLITSEEIAKRLAAQRYTVDWSHLELSRDEAARVEKELLPFFAAGTEIHTAPSAIIIAGTETSIHQAVRLIALLPGHSPDSIWPRTNRSDDATVLSKLAEPCNVQISSDNPWDAVGEFRKKNLDVVLKSADGTTLSAKDALRTVDLQLATLNLNLNQGAPLGLALRWFERRAKSLLDYKLSYTITPDRTIAIQIRPPHSSPPQSTCGADVAFLYPAPAEYSEKSDAAARKKLLDALESHLALFPALNTEAHVRVVRGRLLAYGNEATLRRMLDLIAAWRSTSKPPEPAAWLTALDSALNTPVDWDGRGLTAGKVIGVLRKMGKVNILLEDSADAAAHFELLPQDAELLAPGRYPFKQLLDDLASRTKAVWRSDLGVIVITPK